MSDQASGGDGGIPTSFAAGVLPGAPVVSPPSQGVNKFAIQADVHSVMISFGQTRVGFDSTGNIVPVPSVEWIVTMVMSPVLAKQLAQSLTSGTTSYEREFGAVPADPLFEKALQAGATVVRPPQPGRWSPAANLSDAQKVIFQVQSSYPGTPVVTLAREGWAHILTGHTEMTTRQSDIQLISQSPEIVLTGNVYNPGNVVFIKPAIRSPHGTAPLSVIVNPTDGQIITAYYDRRLATIPKAEVIWDSQSTKQYRP